MIYHFLIFGFAVLFLLVYMFVKNSIKNRWKKTTSFECCKSKNNISSITTESNNCCFSESYYTPDVRIGDGILCQAEPLVKDSEILDNVHLDNNTGLNYTTSDNVVIDSHERYDHPIEPVAEVSGAFSYDPPSYELSGHDCGHDSGGSDYGCSSDCGGD